MRVRPLHDWAIITILESQEKTAGGIVIPDSAKEKPSEGIIEAIGPGTYRKEPGKGKKKKFFPTVLKPGQRVMFTEYTAEEAELDGEVFTLVREDDILGVFEGDTSQIPVEKHYPIEAQEEKPVALRKQTEGKIMGVSTAEVKKPATAKSLPRKATPEKKKKTESKKTTKPKKPKAKGKTHKKGEPKKKVKKKISASAKKKLGTTARTKKKRT